MLSGQFIYILYKIIITLSFPRPTISLVQTLAFKENLGLLDCGSYFHIFSHFCLFLFVNMVVNKLTNSCLQTQSNINFHVESSLFHFDEFKSNDYVHMVAILDVI